MYTYYASIIIGPASGNAIEHKHRYAGHSATQPCRTRQHVHDMQAYGQFSKFHVYLCGLDSGNLKFETVRTNKQHICF